MSAPVLLEIDRGGVVTVDAPVGLLSARDVAALSEALDALRPLLARTCTAPLPPAEQWPPEWGEVIAERAAIAAEGGAANPDAVALADLRAMVSRGDLDGGDLDGGDR